VGGHSLFLGSAVGAILGGGGALVGMDKIQKNSFFKNLPFSSKKALIVGPIKDLNFPFILLKRLIYFTKEVANRPHANREELKIGDDELFSKEWINSDIQKKLLSLHLNFVKSKDIYSSKEKYSKLIEEILLKYIEH